ncbi:DUF1905 domain-containing protein [Streptomyces sp. NPDC001999]
MKVVFTGHLIEWRGSSPLYLATEPEEQTADIRELAVMVTYGWGGVVSVDARIAEITFTTSLLPKKRGFLLHRRED